MLDAYKHLQQKDLKNFRTLHSLAFNRLGMKKAQVMQDEHYEDIGKNLGIEVTVYSNGQESTGFVDSDSEYFNLINAARIKEISILIEEKFESCVPNTMEELISLPGVGRKTANIVLSEEFGISEGIAVDTHVRRVSFRLGLTKNTDPLKIEQDLMKILPNSEWRNISIMLILHGRNTCSAKKPKCDLCVFNDICPSACNKQ